MLIVFVPMFGLVFAVINFKRSRFFADHLMMGLEFMCFMLFFNTIILSFLLIGIVWTGEFLGFNWHALVQSERTVIVPVVAVLTAYFLIRAERTFYEQRWWLAVIKGIALIYCATFVIKLYRFILFHITMWAL